MARAPVEFQNGRDCEEENELLLVPAVVAGGSSEELNREAIFERPAEKLMIGGIEGWNFVSACCS